MYGNTIIYVTQMCMYYKLFMMLKCICITFIHEFAITYENHLCVKLQSFCDSIIHELQIFV
jgi:hypothetical protein